MAIAAGIGARVRLPAAHPTAMLFGERAGRAIIGTDPARGGELGAALEAARVPAIRIGVAGGRSLDLSVGPLELIVDVEALGRAWGTPL
jgi:hypothetical protein